MRKLSLFLVLSFIEAVLLKVYYARERVTMTIPLVGVLHTWNTWYDGSCLSRCVIHISIVPAGIAFLFPLFSYMEFVWFSCENESVGIKPGHPALSSVKLENLLTVRVVIWE